MTTRTSASRPADQTPAVLATVNLNTSVPIEGELSDFDLASQFHICADAVRPCGKPWVFNRMDRPAAARFVDRPSGVPLAPFSVALLVTVDGAVDRWWMQNRKCLEHEYHSQIAFQRTAVYAPAVEGSAEVKAYQAEFDWLQKHTGSEQHRADVMEYRAQQIRDGKLRIPVVFCNTIRTRRRLRRFELADPLDMQIRIPLPAFRGALNQFLASTISVSRRLEALEPTVVFRGDSRWLCDGGVQPLQQISELRIEMDDSAPSGEWTQLVTRRASD